MFEKKNGAELRSREPLTDTQMLMFISIGIFAAMYLAAVLFMGGGFRKPQMFFDLLNDNAALIIISCSLTIVMITGGINISVGGVIGLTAMACALFANNNGIQNSFISILLTLLLALGIGLGFGVLQGFLVAHLEIQPFIVTLAGMFLARGLTTILSLEPVTVAHKGFQALVESRVKIGWLGYVAPNGNLIPAKIEIGAIAAICVVILMALMLRYTRFGRNVYAVGGNPQSALMLGINVKRTVFWAYVLSGLLSGLAGFVFLMHKPAGNASVAMRSEMDAIAASIIGGTLLTGGVGNVIGSFFGAMILATIQKIIFLSPLNASWWQDMANGAMLCFFILLQSVILMRRSNSKKAGTLLKNLKIHKADKTPEGKEEKHET